MGKSSFEEQIKKDGRLVYTNVGDSMLPLIYENRDLLIIEPVKGRLKKYDIPLYKRDNGNYVLHRIIKVREKDYVIRGDNRWNKEYGITDRHIIGVLVSVVRDGVEYSVDELSKDYVRTLPFKAFKLKIQYYYKRLISKIKKKIGSA